jgi:ABC-type dipeptide/oligopeptide/nickel transport system permease component
LTLRYYIVRRLLLVVPTIIGLTLIVFILTHVGGDQRFLGEYINIHSPIPVSVQEAQLIQKFHLDQPVIVQYFFWLAAFFRGDWGYTHTPIFSGPVLDAIGLFLPNTIVLATFSSILTVIIGIPLGVWSAVKKNSLVDHATRVVSFVGYSLPVYWLGLLLIIAFASPNICQCLNLFPVSGAVNISLMHDLSWFNSGISYPTHVLLIDSLIYGRLDIFTDAFMHEVLPVVTLTFSIVASVIRVMRSSMQDTLNQEYIRTARAKGLPSSAVINQHARRNALIPVLTLMGYTIAGLLGGVVLIESIFNLPGIGYWTTQALLSGDIGGIMGGTVIFGLAFIFSNLVVDILYGYIDPRIRY